MRPLQRHLRSTFFIRKNNVTANEFIFMRINITVAYKVVLKIIFIHFIVMNTNFNNYLTFLHCIVLYSNCHGASCLQANGAEARYSNKEFLKGI